MSDRPTLNECLVWMAAAWAAVALLVVARSARGETWRDVESASSCAVEYDLASRQVPMPRPRVTVLVLSCDAAWSVPYVLDCLTPEQRAAGVIVVIGGRLSQVHATSCEACHGGWLARDGGCDVAVDVVRKWGREHGREVVAVFCDPSQIQPNADK